MSRPGNLLLTSITRSSPSEAFIKRVVVLPRPSFITNACCAFENRDARMLGFEIRPPMGRASAPTRSHLAYDGIAILARLRMVPDSWLYSGSQPTS